MAIGLEQVLQIPAFAVLLWVIAKQEKRQVKTDERLEKKDENLVELTGTFADFATKFERQATLLDELVHSKRGGHGDP